MIGMEGKGVGSLSRVEGGIEVGIGIGSESERGI